MTTAVLIGTLAAQIVIICGGHPGYTLDDPYISLNLAQHIGRGHYGLNDAEPSSPSSSLLYPVILAGFSRLPGFAAVPFVINSLACLMTVALFARALIHYGIVDRPRDIPAAAILVSVFLVSINLVGVIFTGLEHSLHALVSVAVIFGLARTVEGEAPKFWLPLALVALPLLRFEGAALFGLGVLTLLFCRRWRAAGVAVAGLAIAFGLWAMLARHLGLPFLPSSVLAKWQVKSDIAPWTWAHRITGGFWSPNGTEPSLPFLILTAGIACALPPPGKSRILWAIALLALLAQILFGEWGWFHRYEIYGLALGGAAAIVIYRSRLRTLVRQGIPTMCTIAAGWVLLCWKYVLVGTLLVPLASHGIYLQQAQMARFAQDFYREPVAVNDLGLVSFGNPSYVLDLWGLGSEEARRARMVSHEPGWMDRLAREHNVGLAMIYEPNFTGEIPTGWQKLARLTAAQPALTAQFNVVTFFATNPQSILAAKSALMAFAPTVPSGAVLTLLDASTPNP